LLTSRSFQSASVIERILLEKPVVAQADSLIQSLRTAGLKIMMGHRQVEQAALFYEFSLEKHVPTIICCARSIGSLFHP
jgi:hypothetical protein